MFSNFKYGTPQNEIGEIVSVIAGNNANEVISNTQGKFVLANNVYNKADYPELFAKIGLVGAVAWTPRTSGTTSNINALTYGNGLYVYAGNGGVLRSSTDGITWDSRTSGTTTAITDINYGAGLFVITGSSLLRTSTDAITWDSRTAPFVNQNAVIYGNGLFVGVSQNGAISTSTNGITWTNRTSGTVTSLNSVAYGNGLYFTVGNAGVVVTSTDAITWNTPTVLPVTSAALKAFYSNGLYYAFNGTLYSSTDGITWTSRTTPGTLLTMISKTGFTSVFGNGGLAIKSTDGITWPIGLSGTTSTINTSVYGNGIYVYAGAGGVLATSTSLSDPEYSPYYNAATQFYVPPYTTGSRFYTLPTYGSNTAPRFVNYVRAK